MRGMLALLRETTDQVPLYLQEREAWANSFQAIATPILIAIGGTFALYKFVFEGAFSRRLQPGASALVISDGEKRFVRIGVTAANIGKRRVQIDPDYTRLSIRFMPRQGGAWTEPATHPILEHVYVEPGETVADQALGEVTEADYIAISVDFYVTSSPSKFRRRQATWLHREIVSLV